MGVFIMLKGLDKMEVVKLMSHLFLAIIIIGLYAYTVITGHPDDTLRTFSGMVLAYFFGAVGLTGITGLKSSSGGTVTQNADNQNKGA